MPFDKGIPRILFQNLLGLTEKPLSHRFGRRKAVFYLRGARRFAKIPQILAFSRKIWYTGENEILHDPAQRCLWQSFAQAVARVCGRARVRKARCKSAATAIAVIKGRRPLSVGMLTVSCRNASPGRWGMGRRPRAWVPHALLSYALPRREGVLRCVPFSIFKKERNRKT